MNKRRKCGYICVAVGILFLLGAMSLVAYNEWKNRAAEERVLTELPIVKERIEEVIAQNAQESTFSYDLEGMLSEAQETEPDTTMKAVEIEGHSYIGYLKIPDLNLELPIQESWDYEKLDVSPCRFTGSTKSDDLVIAGHNYRSHFRPLQNSKTDTIVTFTDMDGVVRFYKVVERQVVEPSKLEDMIYGDWDMTLFTCTYGGRTRLAIRCLEIEE